MDQVPDRGRDSADQPVLRSRLLPRISFQSLLLLTAIAAVIIAVVYAAEQGGIYAAGITVGLLFLAAVALLSAFVFLLSWSVAFLPKLFGTVLVVAGAVLSLVSLIDVPLAAADFLKGPVWILDLFLVGGFLLLVPIGAGGAQQVESPFAEDQLPPQILAPREPTN